MYDEKTARRVHSPRPYYDDAYTTAFAARVSGRRRDERGLWVTLDRSYFYPESGGQEADRGALSGVAVLDVQEMEDGGVWHLVAGEVPDAVSAEVDAARRASNRQQHTGQHVLSQAFERVLGAKTLASRLGDDAGSIDLEIADLDWEGVARVEEAANRVLWDNRPVTSHIVKADELERFNLRRPAAVEGLYRVIEIAEWDYSACGGTHCRTTGEVGLVKVRRWQKHKGGVRVEFFCGVRAFRDYERRVRQLVGASLRRGTGDLEVLPALERAAEERDALRKQVARVAGELAAHEARELARAHAESGEAVLCRVLDERSAEELRALAVALAGAGVARVVLAARSPEPRLVVARPRGKDGEDLRKFLAALLEASGGKGGGGPDLLQVTAGDTKRLEGAVSGIARGWLEA